MNRIEANIQRSTFNAQPRIGKPVVFHRALDVGCWVLEVSNFFGELP